MGCPQKGVRPALSRARKNTTRPLELASADIASEHERRGAIVRLMTVWSDPALCDRVPPPADVSSRGQSGTPAHVEGRTSASHPGGSVMHRVGSLVVIVAGILL